MILVSLTQKSSIDFRFNFSEMSLINYSALFRNLNFLSLFKNSSIVVFFACTLNSLIASMAGYAFAKKWIWAKEKIFWIYLMTLIVPGQAIIVPLFIIMNKLGILNTHVVLFLPIINAFGVFLTRQFMESLPDDLLDAAKIDGCNEPRIFFNVVLPLVKPVIISLTIFTFITSWNDFLWPLISTTSSSMYTLTLGLSTLQSNYLTNYGLLLAGSTVIFLPPFILYSILQKQFIEGVALSGLKG